MTLEETIERLSLQAWPAYQTQEYGSWLLRWANGYTKRANSVTVLGQTESALLERIVYCESRYLEQSSNTIFRLPSFIHAKQLDSILQQRGYQLLDVTQVMKIPLSRSDHSRSAIGETDLDTWLPLYNTFSRTNPANEYDHRQILDLISEPRLFAVLYHDEQPVACGMGVLQGEFFGLFDIVTDPRQRRRGFAHRLVKKMLSWAILRGVKSAYLQVVANNQPALRLYQVLGFQNLYQYWYRVQP